MMTMFEKLCSNASINVCVGFERCSSFVPNCGGFFDKPSCRNNIGWREVC